MKPSRITATSQTEIDFFFIDEALAAGLKEVNIITKAGARPHLPVEMCLEADFSKVLMPKARQHNNIPRFLPFGPKLQEDNWEQEEQVVRGALRLAQEGAPKGLPPGHCQEGIWQGGTEDGDTAGQGHWH